MTEERDYGQLAENAHELCNQIITILIRNFGNEHELQQVINECNPTIQSAFLSVQGMLNMKLTEMSDRLFISNQQIEDLEGIINGLIVYGSASTACMVIAELQMAQTNRTNENQTNA